MSSSKRALMMLVLALTFAAGAWAQRGGKGGMGMGPQPPMPGLQNPVVGSGAEYLMNAKGKDMDVAYAIVGKEDVNGSPAIWLETRMQSAELGGEMVTKMLMVSSGPEAGMKRMITQAPGHPPMEMGGFMMGMMKPRAAQQSGGKADLGELVGTESVTVPAGTYACQHYRKQEKSGAVDYWISTQVTPYSMVKLTSSDMTMVLKQILTNETSHIKGEPQKMQMPEMPHF
ncbi:MAG: hypothetical protein LAO04_19920 [Acidobacteriia bacterium]|nr:hypothetical protein [Terriglobia bacterium]